MSYGVKYRIESQSIIKKQWIVDIEEENYSGNITPIVGSGEPIKISYVNNGEGKFNPIAASEATIQFVADDFLMEHIIDSDDKKFRVSIYQDSVLQWRGLLATDDCSELYQSGNRIFELVAVDGLGLLKNIECDFTYGFDTLINVIKVCLQETYTELPIYIEARLHTKNIADFDYLNPFDYVRVHTKLFMYTDGGPKNLYEVLEVLMGSFLCTIYQSGGEWRIVRLPDLVFDSTFQSSRFSWPDLIEDNLYRVYNMTRFTDFIPINANHRLSFIKPSASTKIQHNYLIPETPINSSLTRGDRLPGLDTIDSRAYAIQLWAYEYGAVSSPSTGQAYRKEVYDINGNITESYIVLPDASTNDERLINKDDLLVDIGDKFFFSCETRLDVDLAGAGTGVALRVRLIGDSGQHYTFDGSANVWTAVITSAIGAAAYTRTYGAGEDLEEWFGFDIETKPFPEGGYLQVMISEWSTGVRESWYRNVNQRVEIYFGSELAELDINLVGERSISSNTIISRKTSERVIKLGESPKRVVASSLWLNATVELTTGWRKFGSGVDERLIDINSKGLHESQNRVYKKLEGDFKGVRMSSESYNLVSPGSVFYLNDASTIFFLPISLDIDPINDQFKAVLIELYDTSKTTPSDATEFKYLFNERD